MSQSEEETADEFTAPGGPQLLRGRRGSGFERGDLLAGRYQIERVVGTGGTGCVLRAFDRVVRQVIAVKVLSADLAADTKWVDRLGDELRHARKLQHPNVCRVFDLSESEGTRFLTMEYADGGSLRDRMKRETTPRPIEARLADARAIVEGLAAIHAAGIIHRDVKPENVLCMEDGRLVVSDFGLAVAPGLEGATFYSAIVGTPSYMAPEVVMGDKATMASDVWALGTLLHELVFGARPAWVTTARGRHLADPTTRRSSRIERALARVCGECLAFLPLDRPQDAGEVKGLLDRAALGRRRPLRKRHRRGIALVAAAAAATAALALIPWRGSREPSPLVPEATPVVKGSARVGAPHLVRRFPGHSMCLEAIAADKVRFFQMAPKAMVEVDLRSGAWRPLPLPDVDFRSCPRVSPDRQTTLLTRAAPGTRPSVWRAGADGALERLVDGASPVWFPSGRELLVSLGSSAAVVALDGGIEILPTLIEPDQTVEDFAVSARGDSVALLVKGAGAQRILGLFDSPLYRRRRVLHAPPGAAVLGRDETSGGFLLAYKAGTRQKVIVLERDRFVEVAELDAHRLRGLVQTELGIVALGSTVDSSLWLPGEGGQMVEAHREPGLGTATAASGPVVLVDRATADDRRVIALHRSGRKGLVALTAGPDDRMPDVLSDGTRFAYVRSQRDEVVLCELVGDAAANCRTIFTGGGEQKPAAPLLSPRGTRLAFRTLGGSGPRLWAQSLETPGSPIDLGPSVGSCGIAWLSEETLWTLDFGKPGEPPHWIELSALTGRPTGNTRPADRENRCRRPILDDARRAVEIRAEVTTELWLLPSGQLEAR